MLKVTTIDRRLFIRKLTVLIAGTLLFIPLMYFKHHGLALAYVGGLLALHICILYVYFSRTPWRRLLHHKAEFGIRVAAVVFFIYLLTLVRYEGSFSDITRNTLLALLIHVGILGCLMVVRDDRSQQ